MTTLREIETLLGSQLRKPPLAQWQPTLSGDIDIHIDRLGAWYHEGGRIERQPLINLFASILRREADGEYYLVTPVEKWRIRVDDTPLLAVDMEVAGERGQQKIIFRLNTDDWVALDRQHQLSGLIEHDTSEPHPCIQLDYGLSARLTRSLFYRLVDIAERRGFELGVVSAGEWFSLGRYE
ncbi:MAG TPA: DUF1285 domain-containing protein [Spongiibacteraceae bacterium]|nr:DUF1285 domain-containing protein [Spongiibacteraceae bacterium]